MAVDMNYFSRKITRYSFLLSIFVVLLHATNTKIYSLREGMGLFVDFFYYIQEYIATLCSIAVPSFFIISGYLFYRNFNMSKLVVKYKSRFFSLVIPYIIWNMIGFLFFFILTNLPFVAEKINMDRVVFNLSNIIEALINGNYNILWFVKLLIIFTIFSPLIYLLIKKKNVGIVSLIVIVFLNFIIKQNEFGLVYCSGYYLFGALIGVHFPYLLGIKSNKIISLISLLLLLIFSLLAFMTNLLYYTPIRFLILLVFSILGWIAFDLFTYAFKDYWWIKISFFIYCIHSLILEPLEKLWLIIFGNTLVGAISCYLIVPILTIIIIIAIAFLFKKYSQRLWQLFTGARG